MSDSFLHSDHYQFDDFFYSPTEGVIITQDRRIILKARENELLQILVRQHPLPATRECIQQELWNNSYATDSTINQAIKSLRDELNDSEKTLIRTIPKTGYILGATPQFVHLKMKKTQTINMLLLQYFGYGIICGFIFFAIGYLFGTPEVVEVTETNNNVHFLFKPTLTELARFSLVDSQEEIFIDKTIEGYRFCEMTQRIMVCKNIR